MVSSVNKIDSKSSDNRQSVAHRFKRPSHAARTQRNNGVVRVIPRKKTMGQEKIERNSDCVEVSIHKIKALSHLSQTAAAVKLGLSVTALKHACRTLGYNKWPRDNDRSATGSPTESSDSAPNASIETPVAAVMEVKEAPPAVLARPPSDIANASNQDITTPSNTMAPSGNLFEASQLDHQDSFGALGLDINSFAKEEENAAQDHAWMLSVGKEQPCANKDDEDLNQDLCQLSGLAKEDQNEDKQATPSITQMEWEDDAQDFWSSMGQADDSVCAVVSNVEIEFGWQCLEHARFAKTHQLWSMPLE